MGLLALALETIASDTSVSLGLVFGIGGAAASALVTVVVARVLQGQAIKVLTRDLAGLTTALAAAEEESSTCLQEAKRRITELEKAQAVRDALDERSSRSATRPYPSGGPR